MGKWCMKLVHIKPIGENFVPITKDDEYLYVHHSVLFPMGCISGDNRIIFDINPRFGKAGLIDRYAMLQKFRKLEPEFVIANKTTRLYDVKFFKGDAGKSKIIFIVDSYSQAIEAMNEYDIDMIAFDSKCLDRYDIIQKLMMYNMVSTPICLLGFKGNVKDDIIQFRNNPWISLAISSDAFLNGFNGIIFDNVEGKRVDLDVEYTLHNITADRNSLVCAKYNEYLMECWNTSVKPKSFIDFLKGEKDV